MPRLTILTWEKCLKMTPWGHPIDIGQFRLFPQLCCCH
jgi:hypothetical protein